MLRKSFTLGYKETESPKKKLLKKLNEFNTYTNLSNHYDEMHKAEGELRKINEEHLIEKSMIFKNTALLNDCKPTKEFLTMEQRKAGYCSISKLNVTKNDQITGKEV